MATKKKTPKKKAPAKRKTSGGIASYTRKIQNAPAVKRKTSQIKLAEKKLAALKKEKVKAVKAARKKLKK